MRETDIWTAVHKNWKEVHCTRVENAVTYGTPDVNCAIDGYEWWLELKLKHKDSIVIRHTQVAFIAKRVQVNSDRNIFIFAADEEEGYLYKAREVLKPGVITSYSGKLTASLPNMQHMDRCQMKNKESWHNLLDNIILSLQL